ncbi:Manganese transport system membrane protein MntB [Andreprevotia sp. IGB-42]|uniref:metal ABC transporter permease n=1 Tax=Andreprevotia sp. IGB-42 TaxID=2497473 RepID=UPI001357837D|nr:metal ABC transporter permease [Andreprevotia sp. IGB-42]KAF0812376.1 Manganese transport system membrane protein MntB [Andreprevotia sp. IGB-42]
MMLYDFFLGPFVEFSFMRLALVGCFALALGCAPIGLFLVLRRMSLVGDAMSHAILPGAAIAFIAYGLSLTALSIGGLVAGLTVVLLSGLVTRLTQQKEDASFAAFYLLSLASGVLIVSKWGSNVDLMHILFGTVLAVDPPALLLVAGIATITLLGLALFYRPLVVESFDPEFLRVTSGGGALAHFVFLVLVVLNLVAGFQALGTLMAVGLMMLPATSARMWAQSLPALMAVAVGFAMLAGYLGLLISYHANLPSGPSIILVAGIGYLASLALGSHGGLLWRVLKFKHLEG